MYTSKKFYSSLFVRSDVDCARLTDTVFVALKKRIDDLTNVLFHLFFRSSRKRFDVKD